MSRTDSRTPGDSWDLASSVGATATMVAAARALASDEPDAIIDDPFAAPLVRAVGVEFFTRVVDGEITFSSDPSDPADPAADGPALMTAMMAVRTRFFDDFFTAAADAGIRQAVILASGLDSRAYRLAWPAGTTVYEIDQPAVIEFKTRTLADLGAEPTATRHAVAVDLRDDWAAALRTAGFDPTVPTAWSAEGLLAYLPPQAQDQLFDTITALSAPGSRLATEYHPDGGKALGQRSQVISDAWREYGFDVDLSELFYTGERTPAAEYLRDQGWQISSRTRPEVFADYGRRYPDSDAVDSMRNSVSIIATLTQGDSDGPHRR
ncbi:class I SAM-dependent methyltransferase [Mycobacterium koreense]|uniref:S-adenosyl-L-methionine-dependent methyltransferase n=1 Tax=Mycolicibacillus koreensis TaxID=1069220 RepID=A0A7I7SDI2_9MYCO|nr:class I SAM-dependent methyltransferase [Mycolicibacillus koreensis]MCV7248052.1 class I SAM-dependent methyltransferase [Mycolicibacillus koreensis]OSC35821.1 SAM-dependent methyltransferase [Mycolicibacillus koreensis]BBY54987.1 putative S-adenosyl-L-methionine-dependent methyltransferase [Mycolicibacillus koreensis]